MSGHMKKSIDLRKRIGSLIKAIEAIPAKHRAPAMERLRNDLTRAAAEYDGTPEVDDL